MASTAHAALIALGVERWNSERPQQPDLSDMDLSGRDLTRVDLRAAYLSHCDLTGSNLRGANLDGARLDHARLPGAELESAGLNGANLAVADLTEANLTWASLVGADLQHVQLDCAHLEHANLDRTVLSGASLRGARMAGANLYAAKLNGTDLTGADLTAAQAFKTECVSAIFDDAVLERANLRDADFREATFVKASLLSARMVRVRLDSSDLSGADLRQADLTGASLIAANVEGSRFTEARVYGIAAWDLTGHPAEQHNLLMTPMDRAQVRADSLQVAQFLYLLLRNPGIRDVLDTVTRKVVLILGRFTPERKNVLDSIRTELTDHGYVPIVCDFDMPGDRDVTETVTLLARMARFVVADLTDPRSVPQELQAIVPDVMVPIRPLILASEEPWSMFKDLTRKYHWLMEPYRYSDLEHLLSTIDEGVIEPAEEKRRELLA